MMKAVHLPRDLALDTNMPGESTVESISILQLFIKWVDNRTNIVQVHLYV